MTQIKEKTFTYYEMWPYIQIYKKRIKKCKSLFRYDADNAPMSRRHYGNLYLLAH